VEKVWKTQEALLKYGESEIDDEADSSSDSGEKTELEEEEPLMPPIKRQKTTPLHKQGT